MSTIPSPYVRKAPRIDPSDKERLILEYAPTIKYIAQRIAARLPPHIGLDDLINAGVIGLIDAIAKYDSSRDNTFKTYAEFRIRGAMLDELRSLDWVPRSVRQKESALERAYEALERTLGRSAQDEEVADLLGIETRGTLRVAQPGPWRVIVKSRSTRVARVGWRDPQLA